MYWLCVFTSASPSRDEPMRWEGSVVKSDEWMCRSMIKSSRWRAASPVPRAIQSANSTVIEGIVFVFVFVFSAFFDEPPFFDPPLERYSPSAPTTTPPTTVRSSTPTGEIVILGPRYSTSPPTQGASLKSKGYSSTLSMGVSGTDKKGPDQYESVDVVDESEEER